jgi:hypothetical protein
MRSNSLKASPSSVWRSRSVTAGWETLTRRATPVTVPASMTARNTSMWRRFMRDMAHRIDGVGKRGGRRNRDDRWGADRWPGMDRCRRRGGVTRSERRVFARQSALCALRLPLPPRPGIPQWQLRLLLRPRSVVARRPGRDGGQGGANAASGAIQR